MVPFESAMVVSYRLSIVTFRPTLSPTIRPQFVIECGMLPTIKSTGCGPLSGKICGGMGRTM